MHRIFRSLLITLLTTGAVIPLCAQKKNFEYTFYGFVRGDLYYNSRQNTESVDGLFYLLPKDEMLDANGKDLNATPSSSFYTFTTRIGADIKGPDIGRAKSSAKIESDFGGMPGSFFLLRIRQAYVKLDWDKGSSVLLGQTWHPFFGDVVPDVLGLSTGAPFQPFNRSPQLQYQFKKNNWKIKATALYQLMYTSTGPIGKSEDYQKNGIWPELCLGIDYQNDGWMVGVGAEMLSLKPRLQSVVGNRIYGVDERITTFSYEAHAKYRQGLFSIAGKTILASNLNHLALIGGYGVSQAAPVVPGPYLSQAPGDGVSRTDVAVTGEQEYTSFRHSTTWVNAVYGNRWRGGVFAGYTKNLGTSKALAAGAPAYGLGMDLDQLLTTSVLFDYNLPHWRIGIEYQRSTGWFGKTDWCDGKNKNTHDVTNHRILGVFIYYF